MSRYPLESPCRRCVNYPGQPDPGDPSRFTIGYESDGREGLIEGTLNDAGNSVNFRTLRP